MKKFIFAFMLMFATVTTANAAWCRAESPSAWGQGVANTVAQACKIALYQCAIRTPGNQTCYVVSSGF